MSSQGLFSVLYPQTPPSPLGYGVRLTLGIGNDQSSAQPSFTPAVPLNDPALQLELKEAYVERLLLLDAACPPNPAGKAPERPFYDPNDDYTLLLARLGQMSAGNMKPDYKEAYDVTYEIIMEQIPHCRQSQIRNPQWRSWRSTDLLSPTQRREALAYNFFFNLHNSIGSYYLAILLGFSGDGDSDAEGGPPPLEGLTKEQEKVIELWQRDVVAFFLGLERPVQQKLLDFHLKLGQRNLFATVTPL